MGELTIARPGGGGNVKIRVGTYTGNGKSGKGVTSLTAPGKILFAVVGSSVFNSEYVIMPAIMIRGMQYSFAYGEALTNNVGGTNQLSLTWGEDTVEWGDSGGVAALGSAGRQYNYSGTKYYYVLGYE